MKKFKIFSLVAILIGGLFLLSGCGQKELSGSLEDIMNDLNEYTFKGYADDEKPMLMNINVLQDASDNVEYYIGTTDIEYEEILASEPMMGSQAYSVVLVKMKDGSDIEEAKQKILDNVNPRKWVCVEVPKEDVIVKNRGNIIILIMVNDETFREKLDKGFDEI